MCLSWEGETDEASTTKLLIPPGGLLGLVPLSVADSDGAEEWQPGGTRGKLGLERRLSYPVDIEKPPGGVAWVSLDQGDNYQVRFWD